MPMCGGVVILLNQIDSAGVSLRTNEDRNAFEREVFLQAIA